MEKKKKVIGFGASISSTSINKSFASYALEFFKEDEVELIDLNDYLVPIFSVDCEKENCPEEAKAFLAKLKEADVLICSMAEHNRNWTTAFKNLFDWCSRLDLKLLQNKPMLLLSTSPGGYAAQNALNIAKTIFPAFGGNIVQTFSLPKFHENFAAEQGIIPDELRMEFEQALAQFKEKIKEVN
ncbi:NAD(P)H-dependent oxidoreductase [Myroides sp. NP-2]|uniref:NADPH-dependent FMN reductase n=1 Tax=Myroides sp. NP-2 TaxID=2759945 RepID=UPI0015F887F4|nr:NADPH-dependent FMN reductase [Myroides sp. NP-2]MBB1150314.1 NAD(P)H-dependent oxidoreductase [Myroides sp. NP-2]